MRRYLLAGTACALLAVPALAFGKARTTVTVEAGGFNVYKPKTVTKTVGAGDVFWRWGTNGTTFALHNVRQDDNLFSSGALTSSNPGGFDVVPSAGSFHYYCTLHGTRNTGMQGRIKVRPAISNKTATSFVVRWSPGSGDTGNAFDVRYRVDGGQWKQWKNDVTANQGIFGLNRKPVRVSGGHTYDIQARSLKKSDPTKQSGWSPTARVST